jgi:3D (Asp-Asp-Asp) domain-containing protein
MSKPVLTARVTVTTYNATVEQTDSNPSMTTFMSRPKPGTIAVSLDLLEMGFIPGKKVWLQGIGIYRINDVMHERHKMSVDLLLDRKSKHFRADNVLMVMVDEN